MLEHEKLVDSHAMEALDCLHWIEVQVQDSIVVHNSRLRIPGFHSGFHDQVQGETALCLWVVDSTWKTC